MSARFWLFLCACAGTALTGGYELGLYATTSPRAATETPLPQVASQESPSYDSTILNGPAIVTCKGCGPSLADRQMAADRAGWDGMSDPTVRDYAAQEDAIPADYLEPPPPARTQPAAIERLAAGESEQHWESVKVVQASNNKTSAGETPADAAVSY